MANLGKFRVGDLGSVIQILFQDTNVSDSNVILDLTNSTAIKITIIDPDGVVYGPFDMVKVNSPGSDGLAQYTTSQVTSLWNKGGMWRWYGTANFSNAPSVSTNDATREILE